jgi:hypothetical protein
MSFWNGKARIDTMTPEFLLTAACCRWPPSESRDAAVRSGTLQITDWDYFFRIAERQRVVGLVHDALRSAGVELPPVVAEEIAARAERIARQNLALVAETVRLQRAFEAASIPVVALKGVALAQLAYGSLNFKHTRDIDLLVPPDKAEAAMKLLERGGYLLSFPAEHLSAAQLRAVFRYAREVQFAHPGRKLLLELHWRATNNPLLLKGVDAYSVVQSVPLSDGVSIRTLAMDDLFAYLCVHGAQHAWSRLKWLADLNALVSVDTTDFGRLYQHARQIGAGICAGQALLLCQRLLSLRLPAVLVEDIYGDSRAEKLVKIAEKTMADPYAEATADRGFVSKTRVVFAQFLLGQGWAFFAAEYRTATVRILDLIDLPLPASLHFLYPLLRLPLWLWRRIVSALAINRARQSRPGPSGSPRA